jgi:drug/metabolite transporter (DMT)-like permease
VVLEVIPPFTLLSLRLLLGIASLGLVVWARGQLRASRAQLRELVAIGVVGYGVSLGLQFAGTKLSTAANGAVLTSTTPAFVFLFALWILKERVTRRRLLALLLSSAGVLVIIDLHSASLSSDLFWGNLSLLAAGLTWALFSVLVRRVTRTLDALPVTFFAFLGGLPVALPGAAWELSAQSVQIPSGWIWAGVLYLGIISTALAAYLWNKAFELLDAGVASLTFFAQPVFGAALGFLFLGERITPGFIFGGLLIGASLIAAMRET